VDVDAPATAPGVVLIHEMYDAGWTATVDDRPTRIERANWLFMAIPAEAGRCRIVLTYAPFSVRLGRWVSGTSAILWLLAGVRRMQRSQPLVAQHSPPSPWFPIGLFVVVFAVSAALLHANWADAFPTPLDLR
jgi:hypothetical protein